MARVWTVNESDCSKIHLLNGSDDNDALWLENTWHEVSPTHATTLPSGTKMLDANNKDLTLLDGYCTTYFYKGWQTVIPVNNNASGEILYNNGNYASISSEVGKEVANERRGLDGGANWKFLQIVRLRDQIISLPDNLGKNLIPDLYLGELWGHNKSNWHDQWNVTPLLPNDGETSAQKESFPRTFTIDETQLPGYEPNKGYFAPELFAPYMYFLRLKNRSNGSYIGGIIVVIGVKQLS